MGVRSWPRRRHQGGMMPAGTRALRPSRSGRRFPIVQSGSGPAPAPHQNGRAGRDGPQSDPRPRAAYCRLLPVFPPDAARRAARPPPERRVPLFAHPIAPPRSSGTQAGVATDTSGRLASFPAHRETSMHYRIRSGTTGHRYPIAAVDLLTMNDRRGPRQRTVLRDRCSRAACVRDTGWTCRVHPR